MSFRSITNYKDFLSEFNIDKVKASCEDADPEKPFLLVAGDLSGIQDTVYTISSKGALKSLRARSFMLELLCEHCCYELLTGLMDNGGYKELHKHVVFSGGGRFCLLLPNTPSVKDGITNFKKEINNWAFDEFSGRLYVAIAYVTASSKELKMPVDFERKWQTLSDELDCDKRRKFSWKLDIIFSGEGLREPTLRTNEQECQICHRDDLELESNSPRTLSEPLRVLTKEEELIKELPPKEAITSNPNLTIAHELCFQLFHLGDRLTKGDTKAVEIIRTRDHPNPDIKAGRNGFLTFPDFRGDNVFYCTNAAETQKAEYTWRINASPEACPEENCSTFLYADYVRKVANLPEEAQQVEKQLYLESHGKKMEEPKYVSASFTGLAASACGADLIGCLRMDIDNLGKIFSQQGWKTKDDFTLNHLAQLSRLLNLFFKVYLNQICAGRINKTTDLTGKDYPATPKTDEVEKKEILSKRRGEPGRNVSVIYSGGDDLFIIGAWDEIAELSFDVQCCFAQYSGLGISGGVTLQKSDYPLYQMAELSKAAEHAAKSFQLQDGSETAPLKNKLALFHNPAYQVKSRELSSKAPHSGIRDKLIYALDWDDQTTQAIVELLVKFCVCKDNRLELQNISRGFLYKLFRITEVWWEKHTLYVPELIYTVGRIKRSLHGSQLVDFMQLSDMIFTLPVTDNPGNHASIRRLKIPLTWFELLLRSKGDEK